jgi:hypothetical protein
MKKTPAHATSEPEKNVLIGIFTTIALFIIGLIASVIFQQPPEIPNTPPPLEESIEQTL